MSEYSRDYLQQLANEPIRSSDRASKIWLPEGCSKAPVRSAEERAASRANASARRALDAAARSEKRAKLLAYYAQAGHSAERVAELIGISVDEASKSLAALRQ